MTGTAAAASRRACVGLGANLGDARATLEAACVALQALPDTLWLGQSAWYRSAPVDAGGPDFLNLVVLLKSALPPLALLDALQAIEREHGRARPYRNAPRTLDMDLLWVDALALDTERLVLPHPRWADRAFVLLPMLDVLPAEDLLAMPVLASSLLRAGVSSPEQLRARVAGLATAQGIERVLPDPAEPSSQQH